MAFANTIYRTIFKRNSVFVGTVFSGAFLFGIGFDTVMTGLWDNHNKGKQWKDIREKYTGSNSEE